MLSRFGKQPDAPSYRVRQITRDEGISAFPTMSHDGKLVAYSSDRAGDKNLDIWLQYVAGGEPIALTRHTVDDTYANFSPDGTQLVFERQFDGIYVIPSLGGSERLLAKDGQKPRYSPDGKWVAYHSTQGTISGERFGFFVVPALGGSPRKLETGLTAVYRPCWSTDGAYLLVLGIEDGRLERYVLPVTGGKATKIRLREPLERAGASMAFGTASWLNPGNRLIFGASQSNVVNIWQVSIEPGSWAVRGKPERLTAGSGENLGPASLDGRIPFSTWNGGMTIYSLPLDVRQGKATGDLTRVGQSGGYALFPTVSSDRRTMVFASDRSGTFDIWMKDLTSGEEKVLVATPDEEDRGLMAPDGSQIAFRRRENGKTVGYVWPMPAGPERKICDGCRSLLNWTPDGQSVIVSEGTTERLVALEVATGRRRPVIAHPRFATHDGILSPDGNWIAFKLVMSTSNQPVHIAPVRPGSVATPQEFIRVTADGYYYKPFWSPDGSLLYYFSREDSFNCLYARRLDSRSKQPEGEAFAVKHFHGDLHLAGGSDVGYGRAGVPALSADGKREGQRLAC